MLENWLEANPNSILEDGALLIIGRQVTTNLGSIVDLLGIDRQGNLVVVELKRDRTPRDTLAQVLEYGSFVEELDTDQLENILKNYLNDDAVNLAQQFSADCAIFTNHIGCKQSSSIIQLMREVLKEEVGIPMLTLELDIGDKRVTSLETIQKKVLEFTQTLL